MDELDDDDLYLDDDDEYPRDERPWWKRPAVWIGIAAVLIVWAGVAFVVLQPKSKSTGIACSSCQQHHAVGGNHHVDRTHHHGSCLDDRGIGDDLVRSPHECRPGGPRKRRS